jgi:hypothetical protein
LHIVCVVTRIEVVAILQTFNIPQGGTKVKKSDQGCSNIVDHQYPPRWKKGKNIQQGGTRAKKGEQGCGNIVDQQYPPRWNKGKTG